MSRENEKWNVSKKVNEVNVKLSSFTRMNFGYNVNRAPCSYELFSYFVHCEYNQVSVKKTARKN